MATVTSLAFPTESGAKEGLDRITQLQKRNLITLHDAAIVSWPAGHPGPSTRQLVNTVGLGAASGMFWGALFGLIFFTPFFGLTIGAAIGAVGGTFRDYGISDDFISAIRSQVKEGTSALFLMTSDAVMDQVVQEMRGLKFEIIATNLSAEQERKLRDAFGLAQT
jgi:uncharacterized membrane protein